MRALLLAGVAAVALGSAAWAASPNNPAASADQGPQKLRSQLTQMLKKSGFSDIRVAPASFVVRAKDQNGNPVVMSISPDEFTEVTAMGEGGAGGATGRVDSATGNGGAYVNVPSSDDLSSKVIGLDVYNSDNKDIGKIKDIALNRDGDASAYILSVGGFLGMGDHYVAVSPSAVDITYNSGSKQWHASMNASADQLKAAPEFKYSGRWAGGGI